MSSTSYQLARGDSASAESGQEPSEWYLSAPCPYCHDPVRQLPLTRHIPHSKTGFLSVECHYQTANTHSMAFGYGVESRGNQVDILSRIMRVAVLVAEYGLR